AADSIKSNNSSTKIDGGKLELSLTLCPVKLTYKYFWAERSVSKNKCLSFSLMFRSPFLRSFSIRLKLVRLSLRGNLSKFIPNRQTTLNGILRIGIKEQKVIPPPAKSLLRLAPVRTGRKL